MLCASYTPPPQMVTILDHIVTNMQLSDNLKEICLLDTVWRCGYTVVTVKTTSKTLLQSHTSQVLSNLVSFFYS